MERKVYYKIRGFRSGIIEILCIPFFYFFRIFRLKKKVVATSFAGRKYDDSPKYIIEKIHEIDPSIELVWITRKGANYETPDYVRKVPSQSIKMIYELTTAKVWINSHPIGAYYRKRKGQFFLETWHGGLGIKKIDMDVENFKQNKAIIRNDRRTSQYADIFTSNSDFSSTIYRRALKYEGEIWKIGMARSDIFFKDSTKIYRYIRDYYKIKQETKIVLYAPTYRDELWYKGVTSYFEFDYLRILEAFRNKTGDDWVMLIRLHPNMMNNQEVKEIRFPNGVINCTDYLNTQDIILSCDAMITDYSSCIFDGALRGIPCLLYANDYDDYSKSRGLVLMYDELPFPYAYTDEELEKNIIEYNKEIEATKYKEFATRHGLIETGHASDDIAQLLIGKIKELGNEKV